MPGSVSLDLPGGSFHQIEFAGVLAGAKEPELAHAFLDHMLSAEFQTDIPHNMFMFPAVADIELSTTFSEFAMIPDTPAALTTSTNRPEARRMGEGLDELDAGSMIASLCLTRGDWQRSW